MTEGLQQPAEENPGQEVAQPTPQESGEAGPEKQYVTADQLKEVLEKDAGHTRAAIGRLTKTLEGLMKGLQPNQPVEEESQPSDDAEPPSIKATKTRLKKQEEDLRRQTEVTRMAAIRNTISSQMAQAGVNPAVLGLTVDGIIARNKEKISVDTNEFGEQSFLVTDGAETVTLTDYVENFIKSDIGKALLTKKSPPNMPSEGGGKTATGRIKISMAEALSGKISSKELQSGKYDIVED